MPHLTKIWLIDQKLIDTLINTAAASVSREPLPPHPWRRPTPRAEACRRSTRVRRGTSEREEIEEEGESMAGGSHFFYKQNADWIATRIPHRTKPL